MAELCTTGWWAGTKCNAVGTITPDASGYKCFTPFGSTEKICEKGLRGDIGGRGEVGATGATGAIGSAGLKGDTGVTGAMGASGAAGVCPSTCNFDDYVKKSELTTALNQYAKTADIQKYFAYDPSVAATSYDLKPSGNIIMASSKTIQNNAGLNYFDTSPYVTTSNMTSTLLPYARTADVVKYTDFGLTTETKSKLPQYSTDLWTFSGGIASKSGTAAATNYVNYADFGTGVTSANLPKYTSADTTWMFDGSLTSKKNITAWDNVTASTLNAQYHININEQINGKKLHCYRNPNDGNNLMCRSWDP